MNVLSILLYIGMVLLFWSPVVILLVLAVMALRKYLRASRVREEKKMVRKSLGAAIREYRTRCKMTQEFVAESIGVSRQAVSKWESGASDPSTSNLFALAKLFGISAEELLRDVCAPADNQ